MSNKGRSTKSKVEGTGPRRDRKSRRNVLVLASLLGSLSLTSVLLLALAPDPLVPGPSQSLFALDSADTFAQVFDTRIAIEKGRWRNIYIHHSRASSGDTRSVGQGTGGMTDHFLIGNGDGCGNGEVQIGQRWDNQQPADLPRESKLRDSCISICLVGDFDHSEPTELQILRLEQLVKSLQSHCDIKSSALVMYDRKASSAAIGKNFPRTTLLQRLAP